MKQSNIKREKKTNLNLSNLSQTQGYACFKFLLFNLVKVSKLPIII